MVMACDFGGDVIVIRRVSKAERILVPITDPQEIHIRFDRKLIYELYWVSIKPSSMDYIHQ